MAVEVDAAGHVAHYRGANSSPDCGRCPCAVKGVPKPRGAVPGYGSFGGLVVVGEAPAMEELRQGFPFVGPSGRELNRVLKNNGIDRNRLYITNALLCQRPGSDADMLRAVDCCRPRLEAEIQALSPTTILALGGTATRALKLRATGIMDARGTVQDSSVVPGVPVVTSIHPAALLRGGAGESVAGGSQKANVDAQFAFLEADVDKAYRISEGQIPPQWSDDISVIGPEVPADQMNVAMMMLVADVREWGLVGLDLEWSRDGRITWLGLGTAKRAFAFWYPALPVALIETAKALLADPDLPTLIQNLQADKEVWERETSSPISGVIEDTMLMHHAAYPGIAHDLQQVVSQFLAVPPWKTWRAQQKAEGQERDKAAAKEAKAAAKQAEHERRNQEAAAKKAAKAAEKQAIHEAKVAAQQAERERKKAEKLLAHETKNAAAAAKKAERKQGASAAPPPVLSSPPPAPVAPSAPPIVASAPPIVPPAPPVVSPPPAAPAVAVAQALFPGGRIGQAAGELGAPIFNGKRRLALKLVDAKGNEIDYKPEGE